MMFGEKRESVEDKVAHTYHNTLNLDITVLKRRREDLIGINVNNTIEHYKHDLAKDLHQSDALAGHPICVTV